MVRTGRLAASASQRVGAGLEKLEKELADRGRSVEGALSELSNRINSVNVPSDIVSKALEHTSEGISQGGTRLASGLGTLGDGVARVGSTAENVAAGLDQVALRAKTLVDELHRLPVELEQLQQQIHRLSGEVVAQSGDHILIAEKAIREARQAGDRLQSTVEEVLQFVRSHLAAGG
jgi:methyl-accepting chemotaxis protein